MNKFEQTIHEIYVELYNNATPKGDFNKLVEDAIINELGQKVIPFDDYEIEQEVMDRIIDEVCKKNKLNKYLSEMVKPNIYLGCSPRTKIKL